MQKLLKVALAAAGAVLVLGNIASAQWGDLKIKIEVQGDFPKMKALKPDKDPAVCANPKNPPLLEEDFVVGEGGGLKNVLAFLVVDPKSKPKIHPSYDEDGVKNAKVVLDNAKCRFEPHVLTVRTGQTLVLKNSDPTGHNSNLQFAVNPPQNPVIPPMAEVLVNPKDLAKPEKRASQVSCSIHPWMKAWVLVQDHPYMAVSDDDGVIEIKNLPEGKHTIQLWQEREGFLNPSGKVKFTKGKGEITIKKGENDLGTYKYTAKK